MLQEQKKTIYLAVPNQGHLCSELVLFLLHIVSNPKYQIKVDLLQDKPIDNVRNKIVKRFLDSGYDYFFTIDSDIVPPTTALDKLLSFDLDFVGGICFSWQFDRPFAVCLKYIPEEDGYQQIKEFGTLTEVDAIGASCLLIKRRVLEKIKKPFETKFDENGILKRGEDFVFCEKVKKQGFKIYVTTDVICKHYRELDLKVINDLLLEQNGQSRQCNIN